MVRVDVAAYHHEPRSNLTPGECVTPSDHPTNRRLVVMAWLSVAAILAYVCRNCIGVAEESIRDDLGLSLTQSGWFMGAFFWSYALLQVPAGILGREWGTRRTLVWSAGAWSLAIASMAIAPAGAGVMLPLSMLMAAQLVMGAAQAALFPSSVQSVRHWIPDRSRARASSLLAAGMQVGAIIAALLTALLIVRVSWRAVFVLYAVPGVVWAVFFHRDFVNRPGDDPRVNESEREVIGSVAGSGSADGHAGDWRAILASRSVWLVCAQQAFRGAGYIFFATWLPTFLKKTRDVSTVGSGVSQAVVFGATLLGSLFAGAVLDAVHRSTGSRRISRCGVGSVAMLACGGLILSAYFVRDATGAVALLAAGAFMAACAGPAAYVATIDLGGRSVPQVFGLMNMSGNLAAAATPVVLGYVFDESPNWNLVLVAFAAMYTLAASCWLLVDPDRCVDPEEVPS